MLTFSARCAWQRGSWGGGSAPSGGRSAPSRGRSTTSGGRRGSTTGRSWTAARVRRSWNRTGSSIRGSRRTDHARVWAHRVVWGSYSATGTGISRHHSPGFSLEASLLLFFILVLYVVLVYFCVGLFRSTVSSIVSHPFMKATSFTNPSVQKYYLLVFFQVEEGGKSATALYDYQASKFPANVSIRVR